MRELRSRERSTCPTDKSIPMTCAGKQSGVKRGWVGEWVDGRAETLKIRPLYLPTLCLHGCSLAYLI
jgi:hypothetical protein